MKFLRDESGRVWHIRCDDGDVHCMITSEPPKPESFVGILTDANNVDRLVVGDRVFWGQFVGVDPATGLAVPGSWPPKAALGEPTNQGAGPNAVV